MPKSDNSTKLPGLFCQLTTEQRKAALAYRGDENHGDATLMRAAKESTPDNTGTDNEPLNM